MQVSQEEIEKLAHLSRLLPEQAFLQKNSKKISEIIGWVDKLNELDTSDVEPLVQMSEEVNVLREDDIHSSLEKERGLSQAPLKDSDYFRVPKVIE